MHAADRLAAITNQISDLLDSEEAEQSNIPLGEWEERYKKLQGIRRFFDQPWDQIEQQIKASEYPEKWIWESRADPAFKQYYALRHKADELEILIK